MTKITTTNEGKFDLISIESQVAFADSLIKQNIISETFKTPQQVVIAIQFCMALNINPMTGLKMMYVVHGKPALFGDGPLSLIQSAGKLEWIKEFWVDSNGDEICFSNKNLKANPYAAICQIKRKGDDKIQEDYFTIDDMKLAQMKSPTWAKFQRTMMRYRARTQAIKSKFADILNGMDIVEYVSENLPNEDYIVNEVEKCTQEQIDKIKRIIPKMNRTEEQFLNHARKVARYDVENIEDLNINDAQILIRQIEKFDTVDVVEPEEEKDEVKNFSKKLMDELNENA